MTDPYACLVVSPGLLDPGLAYLLGHCLPPHSWRIPYGALLGEALFGLLWISTDGAGVVAAVSGWLSNLGACGMIQDVHHGILVDGIVDVAYL